MPADTMETSGLPVMSLSTSVNLEADDMPKPLLKPFQKVSGIIREGFICSLGNIAEAYFMVGGCRAA